MQLRPAVDKTTGPYDYEKEQRENAKYSGKIDSSLQFEELEIQGQIIESYSKPGNPKWVFYIHGGGFTTGIAGERRAVTQYILKELGYDCISVNYLLAS